MFGVLQSIHRFSLGLLYRHIAFCPHLHMTRFCVPLHTQPLSHCQTSMWLRWYSFSFVTYFFNFFHLFSLLFQNSVSYFIVFSVAFLFPVPSNLDPILAGTDCMDSRATWTPRQLQVAARLPGHHGKKYVALANKTLQNTSTTLKHCRLQKTLVVIRSRRTCTTTIAKSSLHNIASVDSRVLYQLKYKYT